MTPTEQFVFALCQKSFLSLWSVANPQGKTPKQELCDILIVCDPDIIIFSVKEIHYRASDDIQTGWQRWTSRAIEASAKQIYGAERILSFLAAVKALNGSASVKLPPKSIRRIHRVAVALGSKGKVPIKFGNLGKGYVHVFDEAAVSVLLRELDTVTDFVDYLSDKEAFFAGGTVPVLFSGEENLLALYLQNGRTFPAGPDFVVLGDDLWKGISARDEFVARRRADEESYAWDRMIEHLITESDADLQFQLPTGVSFSDSGSPQERLERVVRVMARENRFSRRVLAKSFMEFLRAGNIRSRTMISLSGVRYVFLARPHGYDRSARAAELLSRCFIARGVNQDANVVIGLATEQYGTGEGFTLDACCYEKNDWTDEDQERLQTLQNATGAFVSPRLTPIGEDEFPQSNDIGRRLGKALRRMVESVRRVYESAWAHLRSSVTRD